MTNSQIKCGTEAIAYHCMTALHAFRARITEERSQKLELDFESFADNIIRTLVVQAYEESARIAESWETGNNGDPSDHIAMEIRSLSSSVQPSTPPVMQSQSK